jgi:hypothetical protein
MGAAAFSQAFDAWMVDATESLNAHLERAYARLRALNAGA